jgi:regulator of replication initiation timing
MVALAGYYNPDKFFMPVEMGQVVQKMNEELNQAKQTAQQMTEENHNLKWQLRNHSETEDAKNMADVANKGASALKTIVEAAQLADQQDVNPNAAKDEAAAAQGARQ